MGGGGGGGGLMCPSKTDLFSLIKRQIFFFSRTNSKEWCLGFSNFYVTFLMIEIVGLFLCKIIQ